MNKGLREDKSYVAAHSVAVARHHATGWLAGWLAGGGDIIEATSIAGIQPAQHLKHKKAKGPI